MQETVGTLNLKIARLEGYLKVLQQQLDLSDNYPTCKTRLAQKDLQLRLQLRQLIQDRQKLLDIGVHTNITAQCSCLYYQI